MANCVWNRFASSCLEIWDSVVDRPRKVGQILLLDVIPNFLTNVPFRRPWWGGKTQRALSDKMTGNISPKCSTLLPLRLKPQRATGNVRPTGTYLYNRLHYVIGDGKTSLLQCSVNTTQCIFTREPWNIIRGGKTAACQCLSFLRRLGRVQHSQTRKRGRQCENGHNTIKLRYLAVD